MQRHPSALSFDAAVPASPVRLATAAAEADAALYYIFIEEVLQRGAIGAADKFLAIDFVEHGPSGDRRRKEFVAGLGARRERFPNAMWTIELLVAVGGLVVCHTTMVNPELPASAWESVVIRFAGGKIAECWRICDSSLLLADGVVSFCP